VQPSLVLQEEKRIIRVESEYIKRLLFGSATITALLRKIRVIAHYLRRTPHESDFLVLADPVYDMAFVLDLGGNIGQSAISVRCVQPSASILSIEANPGCEAGLKMTKWLLGNGFDYRIIGVRSVNSEMGFCVPVRASRMLLEEGTFDRNSLSSPATTLRIGKEGIDYELHQIAIHVTRVDDLGLSPQVIKMDLQGLELAALTGATETLKRCKPTLMIEIGEGHLDIAQFLMSFGYRQFHWRDGALHAGLRSDTLNAIYTISDSTMPNNTPARATTKEH
jgi:FkbM family methyltransferase